MRHDGVDPDSGANKAIHAASQALNTLIGQLPSDAPQAALANLWLASSAVVEMLDANPALHTVLDMSAWGHVSNAIERICSSRSYAPAHDGLPPLDELLHLVARLANSPYPASAVAGATQDTGWSNWDVRVYAARALLCLAHRFGAEHTAILDQLEAFLDDPVSAVRLQVARNLQVVAAADPERMWRMGGRVAAGEPNPEVIAAYLGRGPLVFSAITGGTQTQHWRGGGVGRSLILLAFLFTSQTGIVASR